MEAERASEAKGEIRAFYRGLLEEEAAAARAHAEEVAACFRAVAAILDR